MDDAFFFKPIRDKRQKKLNILSAFSFLPAEISKTGKTETRAWRYLPVKAL